MRQRLSTVLLSTLLIFSGCSSKQLLYSELNRQFVIQKYEKFSIVDFQRFDDTILNSNLNCYSCDSLTVILLYFIIIFIIYSSIQIYNYDTFPSDFEKLILEENGTIEETINIVDKSIQDLNLSNYVPLKRLIVQTKLDQKRWNNEKISLFMQKNSLDYGIKLFVNSSSSINWSIVDADNIVIYNNSLDLKGDVTKIKTSFIAQLKEILNF